MVGSIIQYAGSTTPNGFLVCDGSAVSRSDYAALFEVIGTTFGSGDGSTTFNLPDLVGRVPIGASTAHSVGSTGGEETHTLVSNELPEHYHVVPEHGHENTIKIATPSLSHSITTQPAFTYTRLNGTAGAFNQLGSKYTSRANASMSRSTSVAITAHPATACTMSGGVTDCPAFDTEETGASEGHNNMMPYLALVFLIQAEEV